MFQGITDKSSTNCKCTSCETAQFINDMYNFFIFCPYLMNTGPQKLILLHLNGLS